MLNQPTLEKLTGMRLHALGAAWQEQQSDSSVASLSFDERLALLVDAEWLSRQNKRITRALREAKQHARIVVESPADDERRQLRGDLFNGKAGDVLRQIGGMGPDISDAATRTGAFRIGTPIGLFLSGGLEARG